MHRVATPRCPRAVVRLPSVCGRLDILDRFYARRGSGSRGVEASSASTTSLGVAKSKWIWLLALLQLVLLFSPTLGQASPISTDLDLLKASVGVLPDSDLAPKPAKSRAKLLTALTRIGDLVSKGKTLPALQRSDSLLRRVDGFLGGKSADDWVRTATSQRAFYRSLSAIRDTLGALAGVGQPLPAPDLLVVPTTVVVPTLTSLAFTVDASRIKPRPWAFVLEKVTESGSLPLAYLSRQAKDRFSWTLPLEMLAPAVTSYRVVALARASRKVSQHIASSPLNLRAIDDPAGAIEQLNSFLITLPPITTDTTHRPESLTGLPAEIPAAFAAVTTTPGMAVWLTPSAPAGSSSLQGLSRPEALGAGVLGFATKNEPANAATSRLLSTLSESGINVTDIQAALQNHEFHKEGLEAGGIILCGDRKGATYVPPGGRQDNSACGFLMTVVIFDGQTHTILPADTIADLTSDRFIEEVNGARVLRDSISVVFHELVHAMTYRTSCFSGSFDNEENFTTYAELATQQQVRLVNAEPASVASASAGCQFFVNAIRTEPDKSGGAACLDRLGLLCSRRCGDTITEGFEQCDDGNTIDGDCCSSRCQKEATGSQTCGIGVCEVATTQCDGGTPTACTPADPTEPGGEVTCNDTLDNDCDGTTDCDDTDCAGDPACSCASTFIQLTNGGACSRNCALALSSEGTRGVYLAGLGFGPAACAAVSVAADGSDAVDLPRADGCGYQNIPPSISSRGDVIVYTVNTQGSVAVGITDAQGSSLALPFGLGTWSPSVSTDGTRVAYIKNTSSSNQIIVADPANPVAGVVVRETTNHAAAFAIISGDGRQVFYHLASPDEFRMVNADGTDDRLIVTGNLAPYYFVPSGDGARAVFSTPLDIVGENPGMMYVELFLWEDGVGIRQLTHSSPDDQFAGLTTISGDGRTVAYTRKSPAGYALVVRDVETGAVREATAPMPVRGFSPVALSFDASRTLFTSNADLSGGNPSNTWEIFAGFLAAASCPYAYALVNLNPGGAGLEDATDINDAGQIVGRGEVAGHTRTHALRWNPSGIIQDLGVLTGHVDSIALGINDSGTVVGMSNDGIGIFSGFLWTPSIGMQDIGSLGGSVTIANDVNDLGLVVGRSGNSDHAFLYDGTMHDLGTLGGGLSESVAINSTGQIVGAAQIAYLSTWRAFFYDGAAGMQDLGTLGGPSSWAYDINSIGHVVGFAQAAYAGPYRAFLYDSGGMRDLGSLPGTNYCEAFGINDNGYVVGYCGSPGFVATRAFVWKPYTGMQDLNSLLDTPAPGLILHQARAINGAGQIVGTGTYNGSLAGFLLTPR